MRGVAISLSGGLNSESQGLNTWSCHSVVSLDTLFFFIRIYFIRISRLKFAKF